MSTPRATKPSTVRTRRNVIAAVVVFAVLGAVIWAGVAARPGTNEPSPPAATSGSEAPSSQQDSSQPGSSQQGDQPLLDMARRIDGDLTAMGSVDAPVVIVEYSDFRCPFCGLYTRNIQPEIIREYVATGQVRLEWRDLPLFGDESVSAAMAARAAGEQGLFWEFHDAVFAAAPERGRAELTPERLREFAQQVGVPDLDRFEQDMANPELFNRVAADRNEGFALGVTGTPSFLVNDIPMSGAQPFDTFRSVIEEALERAGRN